LEIYRGPGKKRVGRLETEQEEKTRVNLALVCNALPKRKRTPGQQIRGGKKLGIDTALHRRGRGPDGEKKAKKGARAQQTGEKKGAIFLRRATTHKKLVTTGQFKTTRQQRHNLQKVKKRKHEGRKETGKKKSWAGERE